MTSRSKLNSLFSRNDLISQDFNGEKYSVGQVYGNLRRNVDLTPALHTFEILETVCIKFLNKYPE